MRSGCFQSLDMAPEPRERSYIVLNAGSSEKWISKRLPVEKWIEISRLLDERFGLEFVLTGSADEREYVQSLARHLPVSCRVVAGKTSLPELKGILREAFLTVSTDSGPMHISAVMKTPRPWVCSVPPTGLDPPLSGLGVSHSTIGAISLTVLPRSRVNSSRGLITITSI